MEQKNMKTPVFANETIFSDSAEQAIDVDFTLPDYCPNIKKILKCRAVSRISSKGVSGQVITVDGTVTITVIYSDEHCRLCSYEYQYPFNKTFEVGRECDGAALCCKTKCEYINCRAVTGRKIDIHGAAGIYVKLIRRRCTDVISDVDDSGIELRRGSAPATSPMGRAEKYLIIEEDIEIGQGQPQVRSLIRCDVCAAVRESKLLSGKAMVKGEIMLTLLYCPEEGSPHSVRASVPFSQLLEVEGVTDSCECDALAEIVYLDIKPRVSASGECRSFQLNAKLLVSCDCYCNNDVDIILDAYSKRYKADIIKSEVSFSRICCNINETFNCKKALEFSEGSLSSVADMWCDVRTDSVKTDSQGIVICGTVIASIIAYDENNEPSFYDKSIPFEYKYPLASGTASSYCEPDIKVISSGYTLTGSGSMELRVDLCVNAAVYERSNIPLIVDVNIDEKHPIERVDKGALTIYFASDGESVWDIARRYCAGVKEIKQINDINEDILKEGTMLLVPIS